MEAALASLASRVEEAVERISGLREELAGARARIEELEALLQRFHEDGEAPTRMAERLEELERSNADMHERIRRGREGVERLLARIRFLEDQR